MSRARYFGIPASECDPWDETCGLELTGDEDPRCAASGGDKILVSFTSGLSGDFYEFDVDSNEVFTLHTRAKIRGLRGEPDQSILRGIHEFLRHARPQQ